MLDDVQGRGAARRPRVQTSAASGLDVACRQAADLIVAAHPYVETTLGAVSDGKMTPEFRGLVSLYREALENRSVAYQFLCFYKIAEGVRNLRERAAGEARAAAKHRRFARPVAFLKTRPITRGG